MRTRLSRRASWSPDAVARKSWERASPLEALSRAPRIGRGPPAEGCSRGAPTSRRSGREDAPSARPSRTGQELFARLARLSVPTVAAIGGPCLGGGLELALALTSRVAADRPDTKIGLPEVKLGILPGFGGTLRLPRLIGLPRALDLILTGRSLSAKQALRKGVVDRMVPSGLLLEKARHELSLPDRRRREEDERSPPARRAPALRCGPAACSGPHARRSRPEPDTGTPAHRCKALEVTVAGVSLPGAEALAREARALASSSPAAPCRRLVRLFLETERARKLHEHLAGGPGGARRRRRRRHHGRGIAALMARNGVSVRGPSTSRSRPSRRRPVFAKDIEGAAGEEDDGQRGRASSTGGPRRPSCPGPPRPTASSKPRPSPSR